MGNRQFSVRTDLVSEGNDVEIQRSWFIENFFWPAPELPFERLQVGKQIWRGKLTLRSEGNDCIHKVRRLRRTIDG